MNIAVILSAGSGTRFRSEDPKQFYKLHGKPILEHSLELFQNNEDIDKFLVVAREDLISRTKEISNKLKKIPIEIIT